MASELTSIESAAVWAVALWRGRAKALVGICQKDQDGLPSGLDM